MELRGAEQILMRHTPGGGADTTTRRDVVVGLFRSTRPKQWTKNLLVFAGPAASGMLGNPLIVARAAYAAVLFTLLSAATYLLNDTVDIDADRRHPRKRHRPIPAAVVSVPTARAAYVALVTVGLAGATALGWRFLLILTCYTAINAWYSFALKHVAVIELFAVASGFVLRAIAGAEAVNVDASVWFVLTVSFAALFVVIGKRLSEALEFGDDAARQRATTETYPTTFLRSSLAITASASIVVYCLWAFAASNVVGSGTLLIELSIVPVSAALLRYLLLVELGSGGAPEEIFLSDRTLQTLGLAWLTLFGLGIYLR